MTRPPRRRPSCRPPAGGSSPPTRPPRSSSPGRACPGVAAPPCAPARAARWWPGEPQDDRRRGGRGHPRLVLRVLAGPGSGLVRRRRRRGDRGGPGGHADPAAAPPGRNGRHPARPRRGGAAGGRPARGRQDGRAAAAGLLRRQHPLAAPLPRGRRPGHVPVRAADLPDRGLRPRPGTPGVALLAAGGIGLAAVVVDIIAVRLRRPALTGLPLLAVYIAPIASAAKVGGLGGLVAFALAASGYLALLSAEGRDRLRG